jgi:3-polyprenyl-4-hydroxybenzoate decarboxylase
MWIGCWPCWGNPGPNLGGYPLSFVDLRAFLAHLEKAGDLARIRGPVNPNQEMTIIQHRIMASGGPALLFENVVGSPYRVVTNLFGTRRRTRLASAVIRHHWDNGCCGSPEP